MDSGGSDRTAPGRGQGGLRRLPRAPRARPGGALAKIGRAEGRGRGHPVHRPARRCEGGARAMIKAVVFDMDGVLIDAKEWHYEALNRALGLFGLEISR